MEHILSFILFYVILCVPKDIILRTERGKRINIFDPRCGAENSIYVRRNRANKLFSHIAAWTGDLLSLAITGSYTTLLTWHDIDCSILYERKIRTYCIDN